MAGRRRSRFATPLSALCLTLQGCVSPGTSITQTIRVETPGCTTASCEFRNDRGHWTLASVPGTVTLTTSDAPLQVTCRADDGLPNTIGAQGSSRPLTAGGGLAGGAAGGAAAGAAVGGAALAFVPVLGVLMVATGFAVGAVAGQTVESHARALTYPAQISVPMSCASGGAQATALPPATPLGMQVRGLSRAEGLSAGSSDRGVLVVSVRDNGRAAAGGLRGGDIILSVGDRDVDDPAVLEAWLREAAGEPLTLKIRRDDRTQVLVLAREGAKP